MAAEKQIVGWDEVEAAVSRLVAVIPRGRYREIIGIVRGGLVPAAMLAYELGIRSVRVVSPDDVLVMPHDALLVDDIADTGATLRQLSHSASSTVLFAKPRGRRFCRYWGAEAPQDAWLVFPWAPRDEINR